MRPDFSDITTKGIVDKYTTEISNEIHNFEAGFPPFERGITAMMYFNEELKFGDLNFFSNIINNLPNGGVVFTSLKDVNFVEFSSSYSEGLIQNNSAINIFCNDISVKSMGMILKTGLTILEDAVKLGLKLDSIATIIEFTFFVDEKHIEEVARIRAMRMLWSKIVSGLKPVNSKSMAMKINALINLNIANKHELGEKATIPTLSAINSVFSGVQSITIIHANNHLSKLFSKYIKTYIKEESILTKAIDPLAGTVNLSKLTQKYYSEIWKETLVCNG